MGGHGLGFLGGVGVGSRGSERSVQLERHGTLLLRSDRCVPAATGRRAERVLLRGRANCQPGMHVQPIPARVIPPEHDPECLCHAPRVPTLRHPRLPMWRCVPSNTCQNITTGRSSKSTRRVTKTRHNVSTVQAQYHSTFKDHVHGLIGYLVHNQLLNHWRTLTTTHNLHVFVYVGHFIHNPQFTSMSIPVLSHYERESMGVLLLSQLIIQCSPITCRLSNINLVEMPHLHQTRARRIQTVTHDLCDMLSFATDIVHVSPSYSMQQGSTHIYPVTPVGYGDTLLQPVALSM